MATDSTAADPTEMNTLIAGLYRSKGGSAGSAWRGYLSDPVMWNRVLSDAEWREFHLNPWQIFVEERNRLISISGSPASHNFWRLYPNAIISKSKLAGAHTDIDENPATPDGSWLTFDAGQ